MVRPWRSGQRKGAGEGEIVGVEHRPFDVVAGEGVGAVENIEGDFRFRRFLHGVEHGGFVGVEAHAGILNIEDQGVDSRQHFGRGTVGGAVEAPDAESGGRVGRIGDAGMVFHAGEAVFGRKKRGDFRRPPGA